MTLSVGGNNQNTVYSGALSGQGAIVKTGSGLLNLSGSNGQQGGTTISNGVLQLGNSAALGAGMLTANGGTLDLSGFSPAVLGLSGSMGMIDTSFGAPVLTVNQATATTFSGAINDGLGLIALRLQGGGTLTLSGSNAYTGGTIIASGELILTNDKAIADGTSLTVGDALSFPAAIVPSPCGFRGTGGCTGAGTGNAASSRLRPCERGGLSPLRRTKPCARHIAPSPCWHAFCRSVAPSSCDYSLNRECAKAHRPGRALFALADEWPSRSLQ